MTKNEINNKLRDFARSLSPTKKEQGVISCLYISFQNLLGSNNCLQVGSYPRFTAITPIHDLDILNVLGEWSSDWHIDSFTPSEAIDQLEKNIRQSFASPSGCTITSIDKQTHSVSVTFICDGQEHSVDVVPVYTHGMNEFGQPTYKVPEILERKRHDQRRKLYEAKASRQEHIGWIDSDPRGYISVVTAVSTNSDFRKAVKIAKYWKDQLKATDEELKLKSFHVEQIITQHFQLHPNSTVFDALFTFFIDFPRTVLVANRVADRINPNKFIDDYIANLTFAVRTRIMEARDGVLINFENIAEQTLISDLLNPAFRKRRSDTEAYLFDYGIPVLTEPELKTFDIGADITNKEGGFVRTLVRAGLIDSGRYLKFKNPALSGCQFKWKVKNDDRCDQPRGEITDNHTRNIPENTKYVGHHYVECYAIRDGICVAKARHNVVIQNGGGKFRIER